MGRKSKQEPRRYAIAALSEPPSERYAALLDHYFGRLPEDVDGLTAWDVFDGPDFAAESDEIPALFAHTMTRSGEDLAAFNDAQLAIGLEALFSFQWSEIAHRLMGNEAFLQGAEPAPVDAQCAAIASIATLYRECLTPRVPPDSCRGTGGELSYFCFMLWDASPLGFWRRAGPEDDPRVAVFLDVLEAGLNCPNAACTESALHGLGHLGGRARYASAGAIDAFLSRRARELPGALVTYARAAKTGCIQ